MEIEVGGGCAQGGGEGEGHYLEQEREKILDKNKIQTYMYEEKQTTLVSEKKKKLKEKI